MIAQLKRLLTSDIKYMYCMFCIVPYCYKIGISATPKYRRAQVEESVRHFVGPIKVRMFPPMPMLFARRFERLIHRMNRNAGLNAGWAEKTDGGTEWHFGLNIFSGFAMWYFTGDLGYSAAVLASPVVWDAWVLTLLIFLLDIGAFWLIVWAGWSLI